MELLFENKILLDKKTLLEWYKKEFGKENRVFFIVHIGLIVLYALMAVMFGVIGSVFASSAFWLVSALPAVGVVLVVLDFLFHYRLYVWRIIRKDKEKIYDKKYVTRYYENNFTGMAQDTNAPEIQQVKAQLQQAQLLQEELKQAMSIAKGHSVQDAEKLKELSANLQEMEQRMERIAQVTQYSYTEAECEYSEISEIVQTENLYIILHKDQVIVLDKHGFEVGNVEEFEAFIIKKAKKASRR